MRTVLACISWPCNSAPCDSCVALKRRCSTWTALQLTKRCAMPASPQMVRFAQFDSKQRGSELPLARCTAGSYVPDAFSMVGPSHSCTCFRHRMSTDGCGPSCPSCLLDGGRALQAEAISAGGGHATGVQCNVADADAQSAAFRAHVQRHGGMDLAVVNAGILEAGEPRAIAPIYSSSFPAVRSPCTCGANVLTGGNCH